MVVTGMLSLLEIVVEIFKSVFDLDESARRNSRSIIGESDHDRNARYWQYGIFIFVLLLVTVGIVLWFVF
jgi:hypothetical protein